ncbi:MAG: 3-deoxy-8-phosphooctulonate synthase [Bacteroidaceae bacterium]|nr:3-deoxy-8-phosphooctulonate synthase [Bacteroidaceae bacterium]
MRPCFIIGPCVIEEASINNGIASHIKELSLRYNADFYFKSSFDKANRTSLTSYRGPGLSVGLQILSDIKEQFNLPIVTDIHETSQALPVSRVADIIQIPAFLCRQTDLIVAAAKTGRVINIKKGQFMSAADMLYSVQKARQSGAGEVYLTERGNMYGYNDLVVDFRNIPAMKDICHRVIMDCTHSVQIPGGNAGKSGGRPQYIESMALAAKAFGAEGYFFEVHPEPEKALCDSACMLQLDKLEGIVKKLVDNK